MLMRHVPRALCLALSLLHASCTHAEPAPAPMQVENPLAGPLAELRAAFQAEVPNATTLPAERHAALLAQGEAMLALPVDHPQLVIIVDRNPAAQDLAIALAQPHAGWEIIGTAKISTGQRGRFDYYITPTGVFRHTDAILGFRAQGTPNENGVRGLGMRGMRVWDFGWQNAVKGWRADAERGDIRLLMHATDPAGLEQRLGRPASQGCVRIPTALNKFLDRHGVLDVDYERAAVGDARFRGLLRADRTPSRFAGNVMVVVDSQEAP